MDVEEVRAQEFLPLRVFTVLNFIYFLKKFLAAIGYLFGGNARLSAAVSAFLFEDAGQRGGQGPIDAALQFGEFGHHGQ